MMISASVGGPTISGGGGGLHVRSLAQGLTGRGHRIAVLTKHSARQPIPLPGVEATFFTNSVLPAVLKKALHIDPVVYLATLRVLRTWRPDIVHSHSLFNLSFAPIMAAAHLRSPVVVTLHSYWPVCLRHGFCYNEDRSCRQRYVREVCAPCLARGLRHRMGVRFPIPLISLVLPLAWQARRRVLQRVARFIAPSEAVARSLRESGFSADQIVIVPNSLPQGELFIGPPQQISGRPRIDLLYVGRLAPEKGVQCLLEALTLVRRAYPDLRLTVAGDGPFRPELERLCASLGLTTATRFIGFQPRSRLLELYAEADIVVIPSLSEVFSYVALEAAVAGVPIVATNVGGMYEIFDEEAILVPPMDSAALARGILAVLSDPASAVIRATRARERSLVRFTFEEMLDRTEAVYAELLDDEMEGWRVGSLR